MIALLIATRNLHKVGEIRSVLGEGFRYLSLKDYPDAPEVVEDAGTFAGNATKKAVALAKWAAEQSTRRFTGGNEGNEEGKMIGEVAGQGACGVGGVFVLADDSGLEVDALGGAPGVHSARYAALDSGHPGNSPTADNNAKLLRLLKNVPPDKRTARFRCVLALTPVLEPSAENASPACAADAFEMQAQLFEGACEGRIIFEGRGRMGFGYDPLFVPHGFTQTFAELGEETKNQLSHRGRALDKLVKSGALRGAGRVRRDA